MSLSLQVDDDPTDLAVTQHPDVVSNHIATADEDDRADSPASKETKEQQLQDMPMYVKPYLPSVSPIHTFLTSPCASP